MLTGLLASRSFFRLATLTALVGVCLLVPAVASAGVVNTAQFDDGSCGHVNPTPTVTASTTPWFLVYGDGGKSSYQMFIDGTSIGTYSSDPYGNVCINSPTTPLADGPHVLTGSELKPNPGNVVTPFHFSVDTTPPAPPSTPSLAAFSDSGVVGDGITKYGNPTLTGTCEPGSSVTLHEGVNTVGGSACDSTGHFSARATPLAEGVHLISAVASDSVGNMSAPSAAFSLTVDLTPPAASFSTPSSGSTVVGTTAVVVNASDAMGVWKVDLQVDGVLAATDTASPYSYAWNTTTLGNGSHTVTQVTTDLAGNTATSSVTVNVNNGVSASVPGAVTLNTASGGNNSVALAWSAPASNGGAAISGYKVYRGTSAGAETLLATLGAADSSLERAPSPTELTAETL